jgi:hypothetical protein
LMGGVVPQRRSTCAHDQVTDRTSDVIARVSWVWGSESCLRKGAFLMWSLSEENHPNIRLPGSGTLQRHHGEFGVLEPMRMPRKERNSTGAQDSSRWQRPGCSGLGLSCPYLRNKGGEERNLSAWSKGDGKTNYGARLPADER